MYNVVRLVHLHDRTDIDAVVRRLRDAARALDERALVGRTHSASINGGDVVVRLSVDSARDWLSVRPKLDETLNDSRIRHVDGADYVDGDEVSAGRRGDSNATVYRTLLVRIDSGTDTATIARFERETLRMATHVTSMTSWRLSRVCEARGNAWTHVWEQHYRTLDGLLGEYMLHPIHWGYVDKWFDPECPDQIITDRVCHSLIELNAAADRRAATLAE